MASSSINSVGVVMAILVFVSVDPDELPPDLPDSPMNKSLSEIALQLSELKRRNPEICIDDLMSAVLSDPEPWYRPDPSQIINMVSDRSQSFAQSLSNALSVLTSLLHGQNP
ncbi:hypothetical protein SUGI_0225830 [Cryptomeria japonica]|nr:hypothetical protein SUGI_0225830 [Cryptomeria japonica]